jgi:pyridoxamine 5'-phosphate oxidase
VGELTLDVDDLPADPLDGVRQWFAAASAEPEPAAMVVATVDGAGAPAARTVLLRGIDHGLVFFTNRQSRKGRHLTADSRCAAVLRWDGLHRQITVRGRAELVAEAESDAYFAGRPRGSRIAAWASAQSEVLADRSALEAAYTEVDGRFPEDDVPRPPHWGGYRIVPAEIEFWQHRNDRLHDRIRFRRDEQEAPWIVERLNP